MQANCTKTERAPWVESSQSCMQHVLKLLANHISDIPCSEQQDIGSRDQQDWAHGI